MGYKIHFDEDSLGADELELLETKKAIFEKLRVRFGFVDTASPNILAGAQTATAKTVPATHVSQPR